MTDATLYRGCRVLVTGASGFIGGHVVRRLTEARADLTVVCRTVLVAERLRTRGAAVLMADLSSKDECARVVRLSQPQVVFNLLGYGVRRTENDAKLANRINTEAPRSLLRALEVTDGRGWKGTRFVHVGSAAEYGGAGGDLSEDGPTAPLSLYGQSKLAGTRAVSSEAAKSGFAAATLRLFTVYGAGEPEGRLLPTLLEARETTEPLALTSGTQRRDFTHVSEVVTALLRAGGRALSPGTVINVATGVLHSVREFVELATPVLGIEPDRLDFGAIPTRPDEMAHEPVNIERCREALGWVPTLSIPEGVARTVEDLA